MLLVGRAELHLLLLFAEAGTPVSAQLSDGVVGQLVLLHKGVLILNYLRHRLHNAGPNENSLVALLVLLRDWKVHLP